MQRELEAMGHRVRREVKVMVYYRGEPLTTQSMDMIVNEKVLVENKAREKLPADATEQLFSYLTSTDLEVGLVLHFGREPRSYRVVHENRFKPHHKRDTTPPPSAPA